MNSSHELMTTSEVAQLFRVTRKTVSDWAKTGKLPVAARTLGGHRRYRASEVRAFLNLPGDEVSR